MTSTEENNIGEKVINNNQDNISDLSLFVLKRVIRCNKKLKTICLEGSFSDREGTALLLLERRGISFDMLKEMVLKNCSISKSEGSDYYECFPDEKYSGVKMMLIFPATEKHIKKFEPLPFHLIRETPELYREVTLPCITASAFNVKWVYNILNHQAEQESIVFDDLNPKTGFILLPDLKWNQKTVDNLYIIAIVRPEGIKSLRDITVDHLPLLKNIRDKGIEVIKEKYGLGESQLRIYLHYQPSYYHLHVHFSNVEFKAPGIMVTKSHLLSTVINNLETIPDYYQKAVLSFMVKESDDMFLAYKSKELVKELPPRVTEELDVNKDKQEKELNKEVILQEVNVKA